MMITVAPFEPTGTALETLLSTWPFLPYRTVQDRAGGALMALMRTRLTATLRTPGVSAWQANAGSSVLGIALVQPLAWDSRWLEMPAGRLEVVADSAAPPADAAIAALLEAATAGAAAMGIRHLTARVDAADHRVVHGLERRGFLNVDALLTFTAATGDVRRTACTPGISLRPGRPGDADVLGHLAARSFRLGRFHSDPAVSDACARNVYRAWTEGCLNASAADGVVVAEAEGQAAGFVACRVVRDTVMQLPRPTGTIVLITAADHVRGRQVGATLIGAAADWFESESLANVEVGTQLHNVTASRLYERCGFRVSGAALTFRAIITA